MEITNAAEAKEFYEQITESYSYTVVSEILADFETKIQAGKKVCSYSFSKDSIPFCKVIIRLLEDKGFKVEYNEGYSDFRESIPASLTITF